MREEISNFVCFSLLSAYTVLTLRRSHRSPTARCFGPCIIHGYNWRTPTRCTDGSRCLYRGAVKNRYFLFFLQLTIHSTTSGIYQQGLFRTLPSRDRYIQLIDIYDSSTDYGAKFSMHKQTMPDICAVLSTFISSLPHPLLDPRLYGGFWHWCVKPSVKREEARRSQQDAEEDDKRTKGELPPTLPMPVKQQQQRLPQAQDDLNLGNDDDIECHQILVAQLILRFLPIGHLSLLIYLCGFFTQLPLCPENGIHFEDIARIYGSKILGGTTKVSSQKMMVWLLSRWYKISEGLLTDACGMSQSSTTAQEELPNSEDIGRTSPLLQTCGARRSRSSDSDRSSYSSSSPHDQAESTRHRKKRSIESTPESDDEAPSRSGRPSRRHRLGLSVP